MGRIFDIDSPLFSGLTKLADLIYLNILTMICCIPIFTIGASMTALNYVVLKMVRNEEGYITKSYFKSFKENFKQATIIWLFILLVTAVLIGDILIFKYSGMEFPTWLMVALVAVAIVLLFAVMHVFPILAKFENSIKNTLKNSLFMGILSFPKTVVMMVCWVIPVFVGVFFIQVLPIVFVLGISGPTFLCALLYNKTFKRFEPEEEIKRDDEWFVEPAEGEEQAETLTASIDSEEKVTEEQGF